MNSKLTKKLAPIILSLFASTILNAQNYPKFVSFEHTGNFKFFSPKISDSNIYSFGLDDNSIIKRNIKSNLKLKYVPIETPIKNIYINAYNREMVDIDFDIAIDPTEKQFAIRLAEWTYNKKREYAELGSSYGIAIKTFDSKAETIDIIPFSFSNWRSGNTGMAYSPSGNYLYYMTNSRSIFRYDTKKKASEEIIISEKQAKNFSGVNRIYAISEAFILVVDADNDFSIFDFENKKLVDEFVFEKENRSDYKFSVSDAIDKDFIFFRYKDNKDKYFYLKYSIEGKKFKKSSYEEFAIDKNNYNKLFDAIKTYQLEYKKMNDPINSMYLYKVTVNKESFKGAKEGVQYEETVEGKVILFNAIKEKDNYFLYNNQGFYLGDISLAKHLVVLSNNDFVRPTEAKLTTNVTKDNIDIVFDMLLLAKKYSNNGEDKFIKGQIDDYLLLGNKLTSAQQNIWDFQEELDKYPYKSIYLNTLNYAGVARNYYCNVLINGTDSSKFPTVYHELKDHLYINWRFNNASFKLKKATPQTQISKTTVEEPQKQKGNSVEIGQFESDDAGNKAKNAKIMFDKENYNAAISFTKEYLALEKEPSAPLAFWILGVSYYYSNQYKDAIIAFNKLKTAMGAYQVNLYHPNVDKLIAFSAKPIGEKPKPIDRFPFFEDLEDQYQEGVQKYKANKFDEAATIFESVGNQFLEAGDTKSYSKSVDDVVTCFVESKQLSRAINFLRKSKIIEWGPNNKTVRLIALYTKINAATNKGKNLLDSLAKVQRDTLLLTEAYGLYYTNLGIKQAKGIWETDQFEATELYLKSFTYDHENALAHLELAKIIKKGYGQMGGVSLYKNFHLRKALELDPTLRQKFPELYKDL